MDIMENALPYDVAQVDELSTALLNVSSYIYVMPKLTLL
jgi:hypothetical protein